MKRVLLFLSLLISQAAFAVEKGEVVLQSDFEGVAALQAWHGAAAPNIQLVPGAHGQALQVERSDPAAPSAMVSIDLPTEKLRGCKLLIEAQVKAETVSAPPNPWNGIKVMLHAKGPGGDVWPQQNLPQGSFDWTRVRYQARVPDDATQATLALGLEMVTGKVWFDDVKISIAALPRVFPATPPVGPRFTGHDLPRLRGTMISPNVTAEDLRVLAGWGANHVRWQLLWNGFPHGPADSATVAEYDVWLESALKHLDDLLPLCRELGIRVVVDLHTPPGGRPASAWGMKLFQEKQWQDAFCADWEKIARRYKGEKQIWGYDLVNEPIEGDVPDGVLDWHDLALETTRRVRAIDAEHAIIIEGSPGGGPQALVDFEPLPFDKIVYSFHMYEPGQFTHQGVFSPSEPVNYPGEIAGKHWDKAQLRKTLQPVVEWQRAYNVHLYVGEFSAIRWAPGAEVYLRDCIEIFEENNWDWAYHAFREWPGWSVEHSGDKEHTQLAPEPTERQKLLMEWFAKNKK